MTLALMLAPAKQSGGGFHLSTTMIVIIAVVVALGLVYILGWRAPDRSPGMDDQAERERIDN